MSQSECSQFPISVGFTVANMQKSIAFYRDQIGFELKECWPTEKDAKWCSLLLDGQSVMLSQAAPAEQMEKMCGPNVAAGKFWGKKAAQFQEQTHGIGCNLYLMVPDVDAFAAKIAKKGLKSDLPPTSQFYGLRDTVVTDPDGYVLTFYTPIKLSNCQSCAMPLADAKPGQMYCQHCVDPTGHLKPYQHVFEGTVTGYFMAHMKMDRKAAEKAATEHLQKQPAWASRK